MHREDLARIGHALHADGAWLARRGAALGVPQQPAGGHARGDAEALRVLAQCRLQVRGGRRAPLARTRSAVVHGHRHRRQTLLTAAVVVRDGAVARLAAGADECVVEHRAERVSAMRHLQRAVAATPARQHIFRIGARARGAHALHASKVWQHMRRIPRAAAAAAAVAAADTAVAAAAAAAAGAARLKLRIPRVEVTRVAAHVHHPVDGR